MFPWTARVFIGYFEVSWHYTLKLFLSLFLTVYCYLPTLANVGRYFDFILDLVMSLLSSVLYNHSQIWSREIPEFTGSILRTLCRRWNAWNNLPRTSHQAFSLTLVPAFGILYLLKIKPFSSFRQNIKNSMIYGYNTESISVYSVQSQKGNLFTHYKCNLSIYLIVIGVV